MSRSARFANNLPAQLTTFIGRDRDVAEVQRQLSESRIVTLTGIGGCGKTRLALQVASNLEDRFSHGVCWVDLAGLSDPALAPQTVSRALNIPEQHGYDLTRLLVDALRDKHVLIILDNCEHLIQACADLTQRLLQTCPRVHILITSQERLRIAGEIVHPVPPLSRPALHEVQPLAVIAEYEAVRLFVERVRDTQPDFVLNEDNVALITQICYQLDGIPLALELAAARAKVLTLEQLVQLLGDRFRLLRGGSRTALPRQRTLREAVDWSYESLLAPERALLRRVAVLAGGFNLEEAEAVCAFQVGEVEIDPADVLDLLSVLLDKSLVVRDAAAMAEARYRLLETIRQYARERLGSDVAGEATLARQRRAAYFLRLVEQAEERLNGADQARWLDCLEVEHDNIRAVLDWSRRPEGDLTVGLRLVAGLWRFWSRRGYVSEGRERVNEFLTLSADRRDGVMARALHAAGGLAWSQGDFATAGAYLEDSLALRRTLGDQSGMAKALSFLGVIAWKQGYYDKATALLTESLELARAVGDSVQSANALHNLGSVARDQGFFDQAEEYLTECVRITHMTGNRQAVASALNALGEVARGVGAYQRAAERYEESVAICRDLGDHEVLAWALHNLGYMALRLGNAVRAEVFFHEALDDAYQRGNREQISACLAGLAGVAVAVGEVDRSAQLLGAAYAMLDALGVVMSPADRTEVERTQGLTQVALSLAGYAEQARAGAELSLSEVMTLARMSPVIQRAPQPAPPPPPPNEPELTIFALGTAQVYRHGVQIGPNEGFYRKTRELFFYLLAYPTRTREQIVLALWPDGTSEGIRAAFNNNMNRLRKALGRGEWILYEQRLYSFNRSLPHQYDVDEFERGVALGKRLAGRDPDQAIAALLKAVELYKGDFLGDTLYDWVDAQLGDLQRAFREAASLAGELLLKTGRHAEAEAVYRRAISQDSLEEAFHRGLLTALARLGERSRAIQHCQQLRRTLAEELGVEPAPETEALCERIRRGEVV